MEFIKELKWRGMLHDMTPETEQHLQEGKRIGYIGFDPTAPSMTIGNFVQLQLLKLFQEAGHTPIILMGGATGRIGDPSGKDTERQLKTTTELDSNLQHQLNQARKFLSFEGENAAIVVNNLEFYQDMNVLEFLRKVGKTLTVSYMMSKDSVKNRLETGLSFTEFSYQLLQAYDFQCLYEKYGCSLQMGGSDQWGNITSGTEFIRRNLTDAKAYAVTTPLLTKSDGKKFGKSEQGNIWLDPKFTSPYKFYQFWLRADDADIPTFLKYFTLKSMEETEAILDKFDDDPRLVKSLLADELTARVHSIEDLEAVKDISELIFNRSLSPESLKSMSMSTFEEIKSEIPDYTIKDFQSGSIIDLLTIHSPIFSSKSEAKRGINNNAVSINKVKITSEDYLVDSSEFIHGKYLFIENGKKNKFIITKD